MPIPKKEEPMKMDMNPSDETKQSGEEIIAERPDMGSGHGGKGITIMMIGGSPWGKLGKPMSKDKEEMEDDEDEDIPTGGSDRMRAIAKIVSAVEELFSLRK